MAADIPVYKAQPLPVWTWAGVYFGAHAGGAWGSSSWTTNAGCFLNVGSLLPHCSPVDQKPGGWVVGGQGGARWQWGALVFGLEGTLAASRIIANDPSACTSVACFAPAVPFFHNETLLQTLYSATAQIGYAFNRTLLYVKGGWAGGEIRRNISLVPLAPAADQVVGETRQARGWTVGAGIEYLVLQNLSLGIEYDYFRLRASSYSVNTLPLGTPGGGIVEMSDVRADIHQVIARAIYRLDWGVLWGGSAPVAARN